MGKPGRPPKKRSRDEIENRPKVRREPKRGYDGRNLEKRQAYLGPKGPVTPEPRDMPIISWSEARDRGWRFYYDGKRCQRGHLSVRRVNSRGCVECDREKARERGRRHNPNQPGHQYELPLETRDEDETFNAKELW